MRGYFNDDITQLSRMIPKNSSSTLIIFAGHVLESLENLRAQEATRTMSKGASTAMLKIDDRIIVVVLLFLLVDQHQSDDESVKTDRF